MALPFFLTSGSSLPSYKDSVYLYSQNFYKVKYPGLMVMIWVPLFLERGRGRQLERALVPGRRADMSGVATTER